MKFSIVTVCFNSRKELKKTIESIMNQTNTDYEYIVVDGGSTDGSLDLLDSYNVAYISEPDDGIYDAMNKAITLCKGEYLLFLNAGDYFVDNQTLHRVAEYIDSDIAYGDCVLSYEDRYKYHMAKKLDSIIERLPFCHQSVFTRRKLFEEKKFNTNYTILADYEFYLYHYMKKSDFQYMPFAISVYESGGYSCKNRRRCDIELMEIKKKYGLDYHLGLKGTIRTIFSELVPYSLYKFYLRYQKRGYFGSIDDALEEYETENLNV